MSSMRIKEYKVAGGVVLDGDDRVLLLERTVQRDGKPFHEVRLPKGKLDPGETDEQAALREVGEESGYWDLEIIADLGTAHTEFDKPKWMVVRDDHYFLMRLASNHAAGQQMAPGSEEALFEPIWVDDLATAEAQLTFESEKQFARRAADWLEGQS
jgi:ADP-ribose pyrophosphatase YjhB (NUDIX family)